MSTWQGAEVIVPNGDLVSEAGHRTGRIPTRRRRMEIPVGVAYGTDPVRVIEVLLAAVREVDGITHEPEPNVLFMNYGNSSLDFEVRAWTTDFDNFMSMRSTVMLALSVALKENGIEIPFPQRDLHLKTLPAEMRPRDAEEEES